MSRAKALEELIEILSKNKKSLDLDDEKEERPSLEMLEIDLDEKSEEEPKEEACKECEKDPCEC